MMEMHMPWLVDTIFQTLDLASVLSERFEGYSLQNQRAYFNELPTSFSLKILI